MTDKRYIVYGVCISVLVLFYILSTKHNDYSHVATDHSDQCFHCKKKYKSSCPWRGQKTKCFSCLKQAYEMSGGNECAFFNEQPMRYYETDAHIYPAMGYAKMGPIS